MLWLWTSANIMTTDLQIRDHLQIPVYVVIPVQQMRIPAPVLDEFLPSTPPKKQQYSYHVNVVHLI